MLRLPRDIRKFKEAQPWQRCKTKKLNLSFIQNCSTNTVNCVSSDINRKRTVDGVGNNEFHSMTVFLNNLSTTKLGHATKFFPFFDFLFRVVMIQLAHSKI